ncbi:sulfur oxidation c-type cytochrome SoxA [Phreatobacter aquaticus]|uniref:SoxAX cytochrome complex subunit A n=1 Tax=Phreatobacter aquaticus TaxID=2570229 RepID=A0A4D7QNA7_9HYPH|nr:sulfur oxidation c-type cytochrome SoxA [Phreatobacter aquaticus]QCK87433.1 sulfur oxidation c-type cytochrome SoxA [Phreatobacter aquaticus]
MRAILAALLIGWASVASAGEIPLDQRLSGFDQMQPETQAMQRDDTANPGMLAVRQGEGLWRRPAGTSGKACADCHGADGTSMRGVSARYPAFDEARGRPIDLAGRINQCRTERQGAPALASEAGDALALAAFVGRQSRGKAVAPPDDARLAAFTANGERLFRARMGQLNFSCSQCHDDNWGRRLGGSTIPQGHANGYPIYRLEWQSMGSLARRLRNCMVGMRAEPFAAGSAEAIDLELYLASRGRGLTVETPAVRP